jgi:hypothetical protein
MAEQVTHGMLQARRDMLAEAHRIIDTARERGLILRLFGGLAVRSHCELLYVCERDYSDIDLVALRRQSRAIPALFSSLGYHENPQVRIATANRQWQFYRRCDHPDADLHYFIHPDDHVDVFLDTFRMDHEIPLGDRLLIEEYTISLSDILLTKLQVAHLNEKDERDVISLLAEAPLRDVDERGAVNVAYVAHTCAGDWGLYYDVMATLDRLREVLGAREEINGELAGKVASSLDRLQTAIREAPKSVRWKVRAKVGTHKQWHESVEDQEGADHGPPLDDPRRSADQGAPADRESAS